MNDLVGDEVMRKIASFIFYAFVVGVLVGISLCEALR